MYFILQVPAAGGLDLSDLRRTRTYLLPLTVANWPICSHLSKQISVASNSRCLLVKHNVLVESFLLLLLLLLYHSICSPINKFANDTYSPELKDLEEIFKTTKRSLSFSVIPKAA